MACVPLPNEADANNSPLCPRMTRKNSTYAITLGSKSMLGGQRLHGCVQCNQWMNIDGEWLRLPEQDIAALRGIKWQPPIRA